jgi:hypothetical protein
MSDLDGSPGLDAQSVQEEVRYGLPIGRHNNKTESIIGWTS